MTNATEISLAHPSTPVAPCFQPARPRHVFISHVSEDKGRIRPYVERLLERGVPVFIDTPTAMGLSTKWIGNPNLRYIHHYDTYRNAISSALADASCVLVFWSAQAVSCERQIFWDEIDCGISRRNLVSVMLDDVLTNQCLPRKGYGFSQAQIADLTAANAIDYQFEWVLYDIEDLFRRAT